MNDGLHPGISRAAYEAVDAINISVLKGMARSPLHTYQLKNFPTAPTPAMEIGTHVHACVLEPERFEREYCAAPKIDRRTKEGKAEWAAFSVENADRTVVTSEDYSLVGAMRDAIWACSSAASLLRGKGHIEVGAVWTHERTGLRCKGLLDRLHLAEWSWVVDLKTTRDASPRAFARDAAKFNYHAQAAYYVGGCATIAPHERRFAWIACERDAPHAVAVYEPTREALLAGEELCERWLDEYAKALAAGVWPGYADEIQSLELPAWALKGTTDVD